MAVAYQRANPDAMQTWRILSELREGRYSAPGFRSADGPGFRLWKIFRRMGIMQGPSSYPGVGISVGGSLRGCTLCTGLWGDDEDSIAGLVEVKAAANFEFLLVKILFKVLQALA